MLSVGSKVKMGWLRKAMENFSGCVFYLGNVWSLEV